MILELEIIINNDDVAILQELGVQVDEETNTYLDKWTFYRIDYCFKRKKNPNHTVVVVNGEDFITPVPYKQLVEMIKAAQ